MVKRTFLKTVLRTCLRNKGRFLANFLTVFFSVAITGGLGALPIALTEPYAQNYVKGNAPDLIIKSKAKTGFTEARLSEISSLSDTESMEGYYQFDMNESDGTYNRFYIIDFASAKIAKPVLIEGNMPSSRTEVLLESPNRNMHQYKVGDSLSLKAIESFSGGSVTISGIVDSPLYNCVSRERAELEDLENKQYVDAIFYIDRVTLPHFLQTLRNTVYVRSPLAERNYFSSEYQAKVDQAKARVVEQIGEKNVAVLTLNETTSYGLYRNYNDKIYVISYIFPFFFIALCALINHITITRFIKDERSLIATLSSLGEPKHYIVMKYLFFIGSSVLLGGILGFLVGTPFLPQLVQGAYSSLFQISYCNITLNSPFSLIVVGVLFLAGIGIGLYSTLKYLREEPSQLVRAEAPMPGKKILMEHIPFLWNRFSFSFKSSFRNIFRQKKNLLLTSLSVAGSTLLVLIGFGLLNVCDALKNDDLYAEVASSIGLVSLVIILFAVAMAIPVLYSLANMNIADRQRELATLKVLGYTDMECSNYAFRELVIVSALANILSLPLCALVIEWVLRYLDFGSVKDVQWWSYLLTVVIIAATTVAVNYVLYPRVKAIDMSSSLKTLE